MPVFTDEKKQFDAEFAVRHLDYVVEIHAVNVPKSRRKMKQHNRQRGDAAQTVEFFDAFHFLEK